jgi:hypothetical protein
MNFIFSGHAKRELINRRIPQHVAEGVLQNPQQKFPDSEDTVCYQSLVEFDRKTFLLRLFVNETADPAVVATVYRTRKIKKYWRTA